MSTVEKVDQIGHSVPITCPNYGGNLWELNEGKVLRYRCHTDHAFTTAGCYTAASKPWENPLSSVAHAERSARACSAAWLPAAEAIMRHSRKERITEIRKHISRLRKFLLDDGDGRFSATGAMPKNTTSPHH